jgi:SAM-dependent methyltransferase
MSKVKFAISESLRSDWENWFKNYPTHSHVDFSVGDISVDEYLRSTIAACIAQVERIAGDIDFTPESILEIGCWAGIKCVALALYFPNASVFGVEPDRSAIEIAIKTGAELGIKNLNFIHGFGEMLPFEENKFDLVVSHTVIEHVADVDKCLDEIGRVVRAGGVLHLEAPNYIWPAEQHLQIIVPPLSSRRVMKAFAILQGQARNASFIDGLQLVYPAWVERGLRRNGFVWKNRAEEKIRRVLAGSNDDVVAFHRAARMLALSRRLRIGGLVGAVLCRLRLYPSLLYTAKKTGAER